MKNNEEIFDLFRKNEHKLDAPPSPNAWDRLERKLDNKNTKRKVLWNYYAAAAGFLLLAFLGVFYLMQDNNQILPSTTSPVAENSDKSYSNSVVQEEAKPARPILMSHREKQIYYGNEPVAANLPKKNNVNKSPLSKLSSKKKLKIERIQNNDQNGISDELIAQNIDVLDKSTSDEISLAATSTSKPDGEPDLSRYKPKSAIVEDDADVAMEEQTTEIEKQESVVTTIGTTTNAPMVATPPPGATTNAQAPTDMKESYGGVAKSEIQEESDVNKIQEESYTREEESIVLDQVQTIAKSKKGVRKKRKSDAFESSAPVVTASPDVDPEPPNLKDIALGNSVSAKPKASASNEGAVSQNNYQINQLDWMSGSWINNDANTKEIWENVSSSQLIGTIYSYEDNNEPYESDRIQIKRSRGKIILIQQNEVFDLIEINGKKATFRSQVDNNTIIKISQSGNKLKISKQKFNNTETKVLRKE